ncbi:MAG: acetate kinase [Clostridia bacterium]|nr:acetate kinase [Clostridia bacterium]MBR4260789.1 acetate kinase [Clostridia bacterium]
MKILVLNSGSSSLKYQLIDMENEEVIAKGNYERIGEEKAFITHKVNGEKYVIENYAPSHKEALEFIIKQLTEADYKVVNSLDEINAVGHRVVQGAERYADPIIIDDSVIAGIKEIADLAPVHNMAAAMGMEACKSLMPNTPCVAVFDNGFHKTIPEERYLYPIPYHYYREYKIRKYGFHGTSHYYVSQRVAELENKPVEELKTIVCHLGQGASLCAVQGGKSVDTSMGLTPLGGIMMCARSGDLDPSIVTYLMKKENIAPEEMDRILNKESGLAGISGEAPDVRDIEAAMLNGSERAKLALKAYDLNIAQFIAKYMVSMQGVDNIVFTAGVGENQFNRRSGICKNLEFLGVKLDEEKNHIRGEEIKISAPDSKINVWVIPTNEELVIARETMNLIK